jgi:hypothetical protein
VSAFHFFLSGLQAVLFVAIGAATFPASRHISGPEGRPGVPERALMAVVGGVVFAVGLMLVHIVTYGKVFSSPGIVPIAGAIVLVAGRRSFKAIRMDRRALLALVTLAAVLFALYFVPALRGGSSVRSGDSPWHLGWTEQLLGNETVPSGPAPQEVARNAYPWGYHAVLATLVRLVPGTSPLIALDAVFFILLAALPLSAAVLARTIDARAGWAAAAAASLVGGFGWISARSPTFATVPKTGEFGADLVAASPNGVYALLPPPLPRELGLVLLAAAAFFLVRAHHGDVRARMVAGATVGLVGLVSVPMFISAVLWMTVAALLRPEGKGRALLASTIPAALVWSTWALPVLIRFVRFGGFVNVTPELGKEWALPVALASWGLLLVGAIAGALLAARRDRARSTVLLGSAGATVLLLTFTIVRAGADWSLAGNATLLHQGRVWPPAHLIGATFAGVAALHAFLWLQARGRMMAVGTAAAVLATGAASPVLASIHLGRVMESGAAGFAYGRDEISHPRSFLHEAASHLGPEDVVDVVDNDELAFLLFQFSGCRLAALDDPRLEGNDLRIRFRGLAKRWDERIASGSFEPTHILAPLQAGALGSGALAEGRFRGTRWVLTEIR